MRTNSVVRSGHLHLNAVRLKLRSSKAESNWPLWATVGQNSSSVQMASANHMFWCTWAAEADWTLLYTLGQI